MQKLFLSYDLSLLAKQKGFPQNTGSCLAAWEETENGRWFHCGGAYPVGLLAAPLYQQVAEWLFKEHNIFIDIKRLQVNAVKGVDDLYVYYCEINDFSSDHFKTPAQALKKGIEQALKMI